jgi:putative transposase
MDVHDGVGAAPANLWDRDLKAFAINVIGDVRQLDKMAGAMEPNRRLTKAGIEFLGLQYHDQTRTGGLLNDLAGLAPRTGQPKGSASVKVKIKYNPANLGEIHVWNDRRNRYVTLPCTDIDYASGLSKTQHEFLRKLAGQENEAFFSREDRYRWRAELCQRVERLVPGLKLKNRRTIARLLQSPMVQGLQGEGVALAFAPARHDGLAPVIENDTLAEHRADGGLTSSRPPRGGAKRKAPKPAKPPKGIKVSDEGVAKFGGFNIKKFKGFGNA